MVRDGVSDTGVGDDVGASKIGPSVGDDAGIEVEGSVGDDVGDDNGAADGAEFGASVGYNADVETASSEKALVPSVTLMSEMASATIVTV